MKKEIGNCLRCQWFLLVDCEEMYATGIGVCHRYPPPDAHLNFTRDGKKLTSGVMPLVHENYWCGEFKRTKGVQR